MERYRKIELIQRSLGIRHKLKVYDSMKTPDSHEELAVITLARWELEDELHAIEEILSQLRLDSVASKRSVMEKVPPPFPREAPRQA
jgi:hypothetical protein